MPTHTDIIVLGAGKLYFDAEDANGSKIGERYLGDTPGFEVEVTTESVETWDSDGQTAQKLLNVATKVTRMANIVCQHISNENLALFALGDVSTKAQTSTPVADEPLTVKQGYWYQLGVSASNPTGVRNVSSVTVTGSGGTPTHTVDTDYELDLAMGRIYIVVGGGIADDADILVDYTPAANSRTQVITSSAAAKFGALRFIADNTNGANRDFYAPRVQLKPNGTLAMKSRDASMQMGFQCEFLKTSLEALYVDGRPA